MTVSRLIGSSYLAISLIASGTCSAAESDYFRPFKSFGIRQHDVDGKRSSHVYTATGDNPDWFITQFDLPGGALSNFESGAVSGDSVATAPAARVGVSSNGSRTTVTLQQRGLVVPCLDRNGRPFESDLFLSGKLMPAYAQTAPGLTSLQSIKLSGTVNVGWARSHPGKGCATSKGSAVVDLTLINRSAAKRQILFYQLSLATYCPAPTVCANAKDMRFFYQKNPFGVNDTIQNLGHASLQENEAWPFAFDVLPRLLEALRQAPPGMDHDPSHWSLSGGYIGSISWGDVDFTSIWSNYRVILQIKN